MARKGAVVDNTLRQGLLEKEQQLAIAREQRDRPDVLAQEVAALRQQVQEQEQAEALAANIERQQRHRADASRHVSAFQDHVEVLLQKLTLATEELAEIEAKRQKMANLLRQTDILRGRYGENPALWPKVDYMAQVGINPCHGLGEITSTEAHLLQRIAQQLGPRRGEQIRGLHHTLPVPAQNSVPAEEGVEKPEPATKGGHLEETLRKFFGRRSV